jgi:hypothetical protein
MSYIIYSLLGVEDGDVRPIMFYWKREQDYSQGGFKPQGTFKITQDISG